MDELDKLLSGDESGDSAQPSEVVESQLQERTPEVLSAEQKLANLNKAIAEAQSKLKTIRTARKQPVEEDEVPKIDFEDPTSKAWDKHIRENVNPLQVELEQEREEVRSFALKEFLLDKPNLARNPEKLKELMETYERLHTATERNKEGVLRDLQKAYAATYHEELFNSARNQRVEQAEQDMLYSDPGVSRGATAYSGPKESTTRLTREQMDILAKWGVPASEWLEDYKKYGN